MVDLQRPIAHSGMLFAAWRKTIGEIAICALFRTGFQIKILLLDSRREFYSLGFESIEMEPVPSIHVLLEPAFPFEFRDEADGLVGGTRAELRDDIDQRAFDIFRHPLGVAADINVAAFGEPGPHFAANLAHAVLHI